MLLFLSTFTFQFARCNQHGVNGLQPILYSGVLATMDSSGELCTSGDHESLRRECVLERRSHPSLPLIREKSEAVYLRIEIRCVQVNMIDTLTFDGGVKNVLRGRPKVTTVKKTEDACRSNEW
jgi:hypothetical protein